MSIDQRPRVHVVCNVSAAETLRDVLAQTGRRENVIGFSDNLSFGPIAWPPSERAAWIEHAFGCDGWTEIVLGDERRWSEALSPAYRAVVWVHRRSAQEYAGFLDFVSRIGDAAFGVVDLTDFRISENSPFVPNAFGMIRPQQLIDARAYERETTLPAEQVADYQQRWNRLKEENAPLRVLTAAGLVSAPITYFDDMILSHIVDDWTNCARVIGQIFSDWEVPGAFAQTGDFVLWARLQHLCRTRRVEHKGDLTEMRGGFVRRLRAQ